MESFMWFTILILILLKLLQGLHLGCCIFFKLHFSFMADGVQTLKKVHDENADTALTVVV